VFQATFFKVAFYFENFQIKKLHTPTVEPNLKYLNHLLREINF